MTKETRKTYDKELMERIEKMSMDEKFKILEERVKEGLIGEEIAIGLFGEKKARELLDSITKH